METTDANTETILAGREREIVHMPRSEWEQDLSKAPERMKTRLGFMTESHRRVRYFVVEELPRYGKPMPPEVISARLQMPIADVAKILEDLERCLFSGSESKRLVVWAFRLRLKRRHTPNLQHR